MAADQKNFTNYTYVDEDGLSWNKRGELDAVRNAVDGSTASVGGQPNWGRETRRHETRKGIYQDASTGRTKSVIFYTPAAFAAVVVGTASLSFHVEGETAAVLYTLVHKTGERQPSLRTPVNLIPHA